MVVCSVLVDQTCTKLHALTHSRIKRKPDAGSNIYSRVMLLDGDGLVPVTGFSSSWAVRLVPGTALYCTRSGTAGRRSWHLGNQAKCWDSKLQTHFGVIWTLLSCRFPFHCLQHFWKGNQSPGAWSDLCFIFSLESWRCFHQLWSVEIPWKSHRNRRQRTNFFLYSFTGKKGYNLPTKQIFSYNFINHVLW